MIGYAVVVYLRGTSTSPSGRTTNRFEDFDIAVYGTTQTAGALMAWSVFRVGIARDQESLYVASGSRPINNVAIDNAAAWYAAQRIERNQPREAEYPFAIDPFRYTIIQEKGLMPILQLNTKGIERVMMEVREASRRPPARVLALSKLR